MRSDADNRPAKIRQSIVFGGALIPAIGSWLFAYRVLEATNPRVAYVTGGLGVLFVTAIMVARNRRR
jgi:hypothetical protein